MPELKHAELLEGVVFMASPVELPHSTVHCLMGWWVSHYSFATAGVEPGSGGTWIMGAKNVPQPDLSLRILPGYGGQSHDSGQYPAGAPELIAEVAGSSLSRDLGIKLDLYRRAGVREYIIVQLASQHVSWRRLARGRYEEIQPDADGWLRSRVFPGLWLNPAAVWNRRISPQTALNRGLSSPEHAAFVKRLAAAGDRK